MTIASLRIIISVFVPSEKNPPPGTRPADPWLLLIPLASSTSTLLIFYTTVPPEKFQIQLVFLNRDIQFFAKKGLFLP